MQEHDGRESEIAAHGEALSVRDVDDVEHAEDQRESDREERVEPAEHHTLDEEFEERLEHGSYKPVGETPARATRRALIVALARVLAEVEPADVIRSAELL